MLNRRQIRVKVLQTLYSMMMAGSDDLALHRKFLNKSMADMEVLYYLLLDLLNRLYVLHEDMLEKTRNKFIPSEKDKVLSEKLIQNQLLKSINESEAIAEKISKLKFDFWKTHEEYVRVIYDKVIQSEEYLQYTQKPTSDFAADTNFVAQLYTNVIAPDEKLYEFIEDQNLTWLDDLPLVNTFLVKALRQASPQHTGKKLLIQLVKDEDDLKFGRDLLDKTFLNLAQLDKEIEGQTPNWDMERIADVDRILIRIALCEFLKFPSIPTRVTINEYIEIAKEYATPKSSIFINGLLDSLEKKFRQENRIQKSGRGLL